MEKHNKVWGSEDWLINTDKYCGKILNIDKGYRSSIHHHKIKDETFYLLEGKVLMEFWDETFGRACINVMEPGNTQRLKPYEKHRFTGLENSKMLEISTHHKEEDSYRDTKSEKVDLNRLQEELGTKF